MTFEPDAIDAICAYMNEDPTGNNLTIVQGITGDTTLSRAELVTFDGDGAVFRVESAERAEEVRIPWTRRISARPEVREELFALLMRATGALPSSD